MIDLKVDIKGVSAIRAMLGGLADIPMEKIHAAMGKEQVERIKERVLDGKLLTGRPMPPSLRAIRDGGITLYDTRQMLGHSMGVKVANKRKASLGFDADRAKIAYWNHHGAKTKNGKWRPRPRPFFGIGPGDKEAITKAGREEFDHHVKKHGGK